MAIIFSALLLIQSYLLELQFDFQVVLSNHFNEGGAFQLKYDVTKNLFVLFEEYTTKPEIYFKMYVSLCHKISFQTLENAFGVTVYT